MTQAASSATGPNLRDQQRAALRDLIELLTESALTQADIERRHHEAMEEGKQTFAKAIKEAGYRFDGARNAIVQQHAERVEPAEKAFQTRRDAMLADHEQRVQQIRDDYERADRDLEQQLQHAIWLAESVFDVSQNQIKQDSKKDREAVKEQVEALDDIEEKGIKLKERYAAPGRSKTEGRETPQPKRFTGTLEEAMAAAARRLAEFNALGLPRLFVGAAPWLAGGVVVVLAAVGAQALSRLTQLQIGAIAGIVGGAVALAVVLALLVRTAARRQAQQAAEAFDDGVVAARQAATERLAAIDRDEKSRNEDAAKLRDKEIQQQKIRTAPRRTQALHQRDQALETADSNQERRLQQLEAEHAAGRRSADQWRDEQIAELTKRLETEQSTLRGRHERDTQKSQSHYDTGRQTLERRWHDRLGQIQAPIADQSASGGNGRPAWSDANWTPPTRFAPVVPFGSLHIDLNQVAATTSNGAAFQLPLPPAFSVPAMLAFPRGGSLLIQSDRAGREKAVQTLRAVVARLLASLPPGRARFTFIDPVGLGQSFAGFMHLADYDEALVGGRIHTDGEQIEQRLRDLTDHMETVIQKYLRNEFATIDEYNAQAGELAEPYRFLVIADFPANFTPEAIRRLGSIVSTGARCGVYTLIARDTRLPVPQGATLDDIQAHSVHLAQQGDGFAWRDEVYGKFPLAVDPPPSETKLNDLLHAVGRGAKLASRVEVPFDAIAPRPEQYWTASAAQELAVPIGRMGATRLQTFRLGKGVAQHALIGGKTGSGKSTLLHVLVTNLAAWHSPDEVEFYLVDFKKGVEFKTYAVHQLPHARAIAVESDREFGLSVLQRLDAELGRRGELFRRVGVQDLPAYRQASGQKLPRTLLVIDEFQEFFSEDDRLAQEAALLLDRLVRQGRAFGVHVLLGSQTLGGSGLPRSTIGQMAVRVALQTSEADSQLILGDNNSAARLLSRPGEAIYNDAGGTVEGNSPFQISWLSDEKRDECLSRVSALARQREMACPAPIVFEGNASADPARNERLAAALEAPAWAASSAPLAWLGEPVAIKEPTGVPLRRQSGANVLLVGQQEEAAMAILAASLIGLAAQLPPSQAKFYMLDGSPADSPLARVMPAAKQAVPHDVTLVEWRAVGDAVAELADLVHRRQSGEEPASQGVYVFIYGLQRYRMLRKGEEEFSFSLDPDEVKKPNPGKQFADILREGPSVGVHVMAWCDTPAAIERTLDRASLREFDYRVLFQMSASDSSNLIDSPAANRLGFHRALAYSEEQGVVEKFRPYALPSAEWLQAVNERLSKRAVDQPEDVATA